MLRQMGKPPEPDEPGPRHTEHDPIRTAGIMPGLAQHPRNEEGER
jgi:hypothetical protein